MEVIFNGFEERVLLMIKGDGTLVNTLAYKVDDKDLKVTGYMELVQRVWPGEYNNERIQEALSRTINITAWVKLELVGCVRILSDDYLFGTIPEILVLPNYQKQGIGKRLMELAWETSPTSLFIGSQPGNELFFEKLGYEKSMQSYVKR